MKLVVYNASGSIPEWLRQHPCEKDSVVVKGPSQAAAFLRYMIEQYEKPLNTEIVFLHVLSPNSMVKDTGYNLLMATNIIACNREKALFKWFWPIGAIGICDREGYPHHTGLPLKQIFDTANLSLPSVVHFIQDQAFAIKYETLISVPKNTYEAILASQECLGELWEECVARLWLALYRASSTLS